MLLYLGDVYNSGKYTEFYNYYEKPSEPKSPPVSATVTTK